MKIEIEWLNDCIDCETCGMSSATGALVKVDGHVAVDMSPEPACFDSVSFSEEEVYAALLTYLGHEVTATTTDLNPYPYGDEDDDE